MRALSRTCAGGAAAPTTPMTFARVVATANKQAEAKQQLQVSAPLFTCLAVNAQSTGSPARDGRPWRCTHGQAEFGRALVQPRDGAEIVRRVERWDNADFLIAGGLPGGENHPAGECHSQQIGGYCGVGCQGTRTYVLQLTDFTDRTQESRQHPRECARGRAFAWTLRCGASSFEI